MKKKFVKTLVAIVAACCLMTAFAFAGCFVDGGNDGKKPEETKYTVIYSAGEGKGVSPQAGQYAEGATFKLPEPTGLSKDKFIFDKWNDGTADYAVGATYTMPAHDVTFTAMWKSNGEITTYTVTFDPNTEEATWTVEVEEGETVSKPETDPVHPDGKHLMYWAYEDAEYDFTTPVTANITLTAVWGWEVKFLAGEGATGTVESIIVKSYANIFLPDGTGLSYPGKVFDGWTDGTENYAADERFMVMSNTTFTAIWKDSDQPELPEGQYTVEYATQWYAEGTAPASETKSEGDIITLPQNTFTAKEDKAEYVFAGWYEQSDSNTLYQPGDTYTMPAKDVKFTAKWVKGQFTVTYKAGDNATGTDITETLTGGNINIKEKPASFIHNDDYTFMGWKIEGTETVCSAGQKYYLTGNVTFVAQWGNLFVTYDIGYNLYLFLNLSDTTGYLSIYDYDKDIESQVDFTYTLNGEEIAITLDGNTFEGTFDGTILTIEITYKGTKYTFGDTTTAEPVEPAITFDANGGSGTAPTATVEYNENSQMYKITLPANTYTAPAGKTFKCWEVNGSNVNAGKTYMANPGETITIKAIWEEESTEPVPDGVIFEGNCTVPTKGGTESNPIVTGGQTYIKFIVDTEKLEVTYYLSDNTSEKVKATDYSSAGYKPQNYGSDALYYEVQMADKVAYYLLIKADLTKLYLCDSDDTPLKNGEFIVRDENSDWLTIVTNEGSEFDTMCENKVILYFAESFENGGTTFIGIQFNKSSLGLSIKTIYMSGGVEKTLTTSISLEGTSNENGCWLVFTSSSYNIVIGKKSDGNYYLVSFSYKNNPDTTEIALVAEKPKNQEN